MIRFPHYHTKNSKVATLSSRHGWASYLDIQLSIWRAIHLASPVCRSIYRVYLPGLSIYADKRVYRLSIPLTPLNLCAFLCFSTYPTMIRSSHAILSFIYLVLSILSIRLIYLCGFSEWLAGHWKPCQWPLLHIHFVMLACGWRYTLQGVEQAQGLALRCGVTGKGPIHRKRFVYLPRG